MPRIEDREAAPSGTPPFFEVPLVSETQRLVGLPPIPLKDARTGQRPRLSTALRLGLRGGALLIRFDGRDDGVVASITQRNGPLWTEDVFEVFLSPFELPFTYYEYEINPLGVLFVARIESPDLSRGTMRVDTTWRCPGLSARVPPGKRRWSALLRIPLASMVTGMAPTRWRANFYRIDRGAQDEFSAWSPTFLDPPDFHVPERFGYLSLQLSAHSSQP